ncbi:hypothetical protein RhiirA5_436429 [Rhizophagus irregularis]|uniref:Uncharacterized protein n=1 Tax=Rhizophagus irregularis TaxID=588596 RepID=A0A2N0NLY3_9GLOM|nr:hypothetical protein RhiirA5_436429 [Rhizophagus irregularis]
MKFNLLLLLLNTLTAVVLSQASGQTTIRLQNHDLYWDTDSTNSTVVLLPGGINPVKWTIVPPNKEKGSLINYSNGQSVKFNGGFNQLIIAKGGESSWTFDELNPLGPYFICSAQHPFWCATAVFKERGWVVEARPKFFSLRDRQRWELVLWN